jgi:predicted HAD superfamily hydrolase
VKISNFLSFFSEFAIKEHNSSILSNFQLFGQFIPNLQKRKEKEKIPVLSRFVVLIVW